MKFDEKLIIGGIVAIAALWYLWNSNIPYIQLVIATLIAIPALATAFTFLKKLFGW